MKAEFVDHALQTHETTAQIVGVKRGEDEYKKVTLPLISI